MIIADRRIRRGPRNSDQKPSSILSVTVRLGARLRDRLTIKSCCFMRRLSATTACAPPGPKSLAIVVSKCRRSAIRSFTGKQGRADHDQGQDCLSYRFQTIIINSQRTGLSADTMSSGPVCQGKTITTEVSLMSKSRAPLQRACSPAFNESKSSTQVTATPAQAAGPRSLVILDRTASGSLII